MNELKNKVKIVLFIVFSFGVGTIAHAKKQVENTPYNQWLKEQFSEQHQSLIPIVAVADIYFACQKEQQNDEPPMTVDFLVNEMDKNELAMRLEQCLQGASIHSDKAVNFGLHGCFFEQLKSLPETERNQKMKLVRRAIASLSPEERKKSLTQCVTDQAIKYIK